MREPQTPGDGVRGYTSKVIGAVREHMRWSEPYRQALATRLARLTPSEYHTLPGRLVVSLTSSRPQFRTLGLTVRSLLSQDIFPDLLVLWVAYDDFEHLPRSVTRLQFHGLVIKQCADTGPYKAIIPAIETYPQAFIVTADGNAYYPPDWLRRLVAAFHDPGEILCRSARRTVLQDNCLAPYARWEPLSQDGETGSHVFFTNAEGVLYPPHSLAREVTDEDSFMRRCPGNPDIWLNWMAARAGSRVRLVHPIALMTWPDPLRNAPWRAGKAPRDDDRQIAAMLEAYGPLDPNPAVVPGGTRGAQIVAFRRKTAHAR